MKALLVFHDHGAGFLSRLLKPGFRHVFCCLEKDGYWVRVDGLLGKPLVDVVAGSDFDLATFYRAEGFTVIETEQGEVPSGCPFAIANCVGLAKAMLCIRSWAITPYGLYRYMTRRLR